MRWFLIILIVICALPPSASAQSGWKPNQKRGGGSQSPNIDRYTPDPNLNRYYSEDSSRTKLADARRDSIVRAAVEGVQPVAATDWDAVLPWRPLAPDLLERISEQTSMSPEQLRTYFAKHLRKRSALSVTSLFARPDLTDLNDIFLAEELNGTDRRNHGAFTWMKGIAIDYRRRIGRNWGLRDYYTWSTAISKDRDTWSYEAVEDGPVITTRDEQRVQVQLHTFGVDAFLDGAIRRLMWSVFFGAEVHLAKVGISYDFEADERYNYDVESDLAGGLGLRAGLTTYTPVIGTLGIRCETGYRIARLQSLKMNDRAWYWSDSEDQEVDAQIQTGGFFASVGLAYFF